MQNLNTLSDADLFRLCRRYGANALMWRRRFAGLLPEVERRRLYEKKGFGDIFEFAHRLAGMSQRQVSEALNLDGRLKSTPLLHGMFVRGEVSPNKLYRVAPIATPENQGVLANQVQLLSSRALETLVRDQKAVARPEVKNGLHEPKKDHKIPHVRMTELHFDDDVKDELMELQNKGIDINAMLRELLEKRKGEIQEGKDRLAKEQEGAEAKRYIPAPIRRILTKEYGTKCAKPHCHRPAEQLHHTNRWSMSQSHDPHYLAPLCKEHHQIAHSVDVKYHETRAASLSGDGG